VYLTVNGRQHRLEVGRDFPLTMTLATFLREKLGLTGLKISCSEGACGAAHYHGQPAVLSCMLLAVEAHGHEVLTIEGLPKDDPVITAFAGSASRATARPCSAATARRLCYDRPRAPR